MKPAGGSIPAREQLALALLSGILLAAPFLRPALSWLHFVALVPWALLLARPAVRHAWLYFLPGAYAFWIMVWGQFSLFSKALPFALALLFVPFSLVFKKPDFPIRDVHRAHQANAWWEPVKGASWKHPSGPGSDIKGKISPILYVLGIVLAFVRPWLSIGIYVLVAVMWLIPDRRIEKVLHER